MAGRRLPTRAPFHLEATVRVLQRRPVNAAEVWDGRRWLHVFASTDGPVLTALENHGAIDAPDLRLSILTGSPSPRTRRHLEQTVRRMLGLDVNPLPLQAAAERLRSLRRTARVLRGMRPPRFAGLFETFGNVVPFQQLSLDAGTAIVGRLIERFGERVRYGDRHYSLFPDAGVVSTASLPALLGCGLSRSKAECLRHLAAAIDSGELTEEAISQLDTSEALTRLVQLPGIGPWSAALVLLRGFGRLEIFPPGDAGAVRGLNGLLGLETADELARIVERFGDLRGYLYFCGLGANLLARGLIRSAP